MSIVISPWLAYLVQAVVLLVFMWTNRAGNVGPGAALLCLSLLAACTAAGYYLPAGRRRHAGDEAQAVRTRLLLPLGYVAGVAVVAGNLLLLGRIARELGVGEVWSGLWSTVGLPVQLQLNYGYFTEQAAALYSLAPLSALVLTYAWKQFRSKPALYLLVLVISLQFVRSIVWAERLALIEVVVPVVVVQFAGGRRQRVVRRLMLVVGALVVAASVFALGDLTRSSSGNSTVDTLQNYYGQSVNNFGHLLGRDVGGVSRGFWTVKPLLNLPVLGPLFDLNGAFQSATGVVPLTTREQSFSYAYILGVDPMYNTYSMYGFLYLDFGWGFLVVVAFVGVSTGFAWRRWQSEDPVGLIMYPLLYLNLLDSLRTWYVGTDRFCYSLALGVLFLFVAQIRAFRAERGTIA